MRKLITMGIILTLALGLTGCSLFAPAEPEPTEPAVTVEPDVVKEDVEPLIYSTEGVEVKVTKDESTFDLTAEKLISMADECGTEHEEGYFENLVKAYENTPKYTYEFKYDGESQDPDTYTVTVLVNRMEYIDLDSVKADFDQCFAGGDMYPIDYAYHHIIFASGCGSGLADGSDNPIGCAVIKEIVEPTLEINPKAAFI